MSDLHPQFSLPTLSAVQREEHVRTLLEIGAIPTAAGREQRVVRWIERWADPAHPRVQRGELARVDLTRDGAGNLHIAMQGGQGGDVSQRPIYFTAHMDHPAFVVERIVSPSVVELSFRGGVMDEYFMDARVVAHDGSDVPHTGRLLEVLRDAPGPFKRYLCELDGAAASHGTIAIGDVATWDVGRAEVRDGKAHLPACDDLAALAAAICAYDVLRVRARAWESSRAGPAPLDVRLLFTRAEEIGFIGAIAAVREGTMPRNARVIALENSRSFTESPIHGGPIVRVGDRMSVFSPTLTDAIAKRAEQIAGAPSTVTATQKLSQLPSWKWQRKLMAGGACEASVFYHAGYEATCVCLPLGNYHNMANLAEVQDGQEGARARIEREFIGVDDYHGLIDLLVACGVHLPEHGAKAAMFDKLWNERSFVLA